MQIIISAAVIVLSVILFRVKCVSTQIKGPINNSKRKASELPPNPSKKTAPIEALNDLNWKLIERRRQRVFKPIYNISMGIKRDTPSEHITIDEGYLERIYHRKELIAAYPDTVLGFISGGEEPVRELYSYMLTDYLPVRFPAMFQLSNNGHDFTNLVTGQIYPIQAPIDIKGALRSLGEIVEEELFLLTPSPSGHRVVAYICCFPSGFNPARLLGQNLDSIHKPVPGYEKIGPSMERYLQRLEIDKPVKRSNWTVQQHPELLDCEVNDRLKKLRTYRKSRIRYETRESPYLSKTLARLPPQTFLRSELQTLSRLPKTGAVLFTIKTYMYNICEIKEEGRGCEFAEAIEGLRKGNVPGMWEYKGAERWGGDGVQVSSQ
ncbi:uncharacterized protein N0V89_007973 [Didymosphaeria variabile]|uniref:Uncharacterized protein n=1 Tax=Didymosphaeria variabile TaxID=1932322 RepID=A0A9W8XEW3_9PLEO|nr:uncharacterized protein N0V89_007973 [Didymosphaeria variabile]KAJ4349359.1 hypothetical protein N0V89_007973 [Didymosphaeria variabile]